VTRRRWILLIAIVAGILVPIAIIAAARIPFSSDTLRQRLVTALEERLEADVNLETLTLRFQPRFHAVGTGLRVRHKRRHDVPPLISIETFTVDSNLLELWRRQVASVKLDGLTIQVPPDTPDESSVSNMAGSALTPRANATDGTGDYVKQVVIRELDAPDAQLIVLRRDPTKPPRTWHLHQLHLKSVGVDTNMPFETLLTNAVPPGEISAKGTFGPWQRDDPGRTALDGLFTFRDADLSVFDGISGILSAEGDFKGTLERIDINGRTETPDFMIDISHHPVPLSTTYHALVDATNGDTMLDPVDAKFLNTSITARGGVYEMEGIKGRVVKLDVTMEDGQLEDLMRLAVPTPQPPMAGRLNLTTKFVLPPGKRNVVDKLQLDGRFAIERGRFTDAIVQKKINELSRRASARALDAPDAPARRSVGSGFAGRFALNNGRLAVPTVTFDVPGALVELTGQYGLKREDIAFNGNLYMDAKISQTVTGFKSLLLKVVDPLFRHNGKTVVPIKISGTRNDPQFGVNVRQVFRRSSDPSDKRLTPPPPSRSPGNR
jgi:hypothetical protein